MSAAKIKYTLKDVLESYGPKRRLDRQNVNAVITRWPSFLVTPLFLRLGITPNRITVASFLVGCLSIVCLAIPDRRYQIAAYFGLYIATYLDYVDGNVARALGWTNYFGKFLDGALGTAYKVFVYLAIGSCLSCGYDATVTAVPANYMAVFGGVASLALLLKTYFLTRLRGELFELRFARVKLPGDSVKAAPQGVKRYVSLIWAIVMRGIKELEWPLLIVGMIYGLDLYLLFFGSAAICDAIVKSASVFLEASRNLRHPRAT